MDDKSPTKILLVEDDAALARVYKTKLEKTGYEITMAGDGEECLELLPKCQPDIILLDIIIPKVDGFTVLKRIKSNAQTKMIPVILLTNLGQDEDVQKGKEMGAQDYLVKSNFTPAEVVKKIEEVLNT